MGFGAAPVEGWATELGVRRIMATDHGHRQLKVEPPTFPQAIWAIAGSTVCTFAGVLVGLLVPGDGNLAHIALICITAFCGWLFWARRKQSVWSTIGLCLAMLFAWYPLALVLRAATWY
jgi:hypothetical protein